MATGYGRGWTRCKVITNCLRLIEAWPLMYHVRYSLRHVIRVLVRELRRGETGKEKGNKREFIKKKRKKKKISDPWQNLYFSPAVGVGGAFIFNADQQNDSNNQMLKGGLLVIIASSSEQNWHGASARHVHVK